MCLGTALGGRVTCSDSDGARTRAVRPPAEREGRAQPCCYEALWSVLLPPRAGRRCVGRHADWLYPGKVASSEGSCACAVERAAERRRA